MLASLVAAIAAGYGVARGLGQSPLLGMGNAGLIALISGLLIPDAPARQMARFFGWLSAAYPLGLLASVGLAHHRGFALTLLAVVVFVQFYAVRFGAAGLYFGVMLFASYISGLLAPVALHEYPHLLLIAAAAAGACLVAREMVSWQSPTWQQRQTGHAFEAACRRAASSTARVMALNGPPERATRRLRHDLERVNTIALIFDGSLASVDNGRGEYLQHRVFDLEHAVVSLSEIGAELAATQPTTTQLPAPFAVVVEELSELAAGRDGSGSAVRSHALAAREGSLGAVDARIPPLMERAADEIDAFSLSRRVFNDDASFVAEPYSSFTPAVPLEGANPVGARPLAGRAAAGAPPMWWRGVRRPAPTTVLAIQAVIAVAIAIPLGDALDPQRYYWAVIGAVIMIVGVSTPHERGRKVMSRLTGTVLGAVLGLTVHHFVGHGHPWWTLTIIVLALSLGAYALASSYSIFVTFLVIALVQLYAVTSGDLDVLMVHRLAENMIGAVAAVVITFLVLPIATHAVLRVGLHGYLAAIRGFLVSLNRHLTDPDGHGGLRSESRTLDHTLFQARQVAAPLVFRSPDRLARLAALPGAAAGSHERLDGVLEAMSAAAGQVRTIARYAPTARARSASVTAGIIEIIEVLSTSLELLGGRIDGSEQREWISCGPLIDELLTELSDDDDDLALTLLGLRELDSRLSVIAAGLSHSIPDRPSEAAPGRTWFQPLIRAN